MLNSEGVRELAYVVRIDDIQPIEGADRVELAFVGGWRIMVRKGQFLPNDLAIYFEIDSKVPAKEPFMFLEPKGYKVKTQRYFKGTVLSQGLLMSAEDFGWTIANDDVGYPYEIIDSDGCPHVVEDDSRFLTSALRVTYTVVEDNERKANSVDKYKKMAQRNGKLFSKQPFRWLMRRTWGKKLLFIFFGKKRDKKSGWPDWVSKTDEERIQNMPWILKDTGEWVVTEKIDGTSTTFAMKRGRGKGQFDFYVCSRNVVFDTPDKNCYYDTNVYLEMAEKYNVRAILEALLDEHSNWDWVTIQGETYGPSVQKRDYSFSERAFMAFNFITSADGRWNSVDAEHLLFPRGIPFVPILDTHYHLPDTVEELLAYAEGESMVDGKEREGLVLRSHDGVQSFKAVSNSFLEKYHS